MKIGRLYSLFILLTGFLFTQADLCIAQNKSASQDTLINLAKLTSTTTSTSFVSGWESLAAINDGLVATSSTSRTYAVYGNWNGDADYGKYNWVQYEWPFAHRIKSLYVYWFSDGGGIMPPTSAFIEYWNGLKWVNAGNIGKTLNTFNKLDTAVTASKIRLSMKSSSSTGIIEFKVMGYQTTQCTASKLNTFVTVGDSTQESGNCANLLAGDSLAFDFQVDSLTDIPGNWLWSGPNNFSSSDKKLILRNIQKNQSGTYSLSYVNTCGSVTTANYYLTVLDSDKGESYTWPAYTPTLKYHFRQEFPSLTMPTKDLNDCSNVAGTTSSEWWSFKWGPKASSKVTPIAITNMLKKLNTDFAYIRDTMGWPPDKRAKMGYRSTVYLFGSGLCTDSADSTALGGWQGATTYAGQSWPMVLLSYYPIACFDPKFSATDKGFQTEAVIHEGIHALLADLPGCKDAAWFQEGGNTWLQQEMASTKTKDYSSMGFLNAGPYIAPFMPIECYSGWLQDDSFGGPSAEGVNMFNGTQQICTWRNLLGGVQYGNTFPVFLGQVLGKGSIPWLWRYCKSRVLEGMADTLGAVQTRRIITEYRAKQTLVDMGNWTGAIKKLLDANFMGTIKAEWTPSWKTPAAWIATPYAKTTKDVNGWLVPEYRTTPGWSGANQIPIHVTGDLVVVNFQPLGDNMTCQLCYRTAKGETVYGQPVNGGECKLSIDPLKKPANGVVLIVVANTNYKYEGEQTRKAHYDYRLKLGQGVNRIASIYKKWYNWNTVISDPSEVEEIAKNPDEIAKIYPNPLNKNQQLTLEIKSPDSLPAQLNIYGLNGKTILAKKINEQYVNISKANLSSGIYLISLRTDAGTMSQKLIVQ